MSGRRTPSVRDLCSEGGTDARATPEAIEAMAGSLEQIAALHGVDPGKWSWRHGAIAWRCEYLRSLAGRPLVGLPIDRTIRQLQMVSVFVLLLAGAAALALIA